MTMSGEVPFVNDEERDSSLYSEEAKQRLKDALEYCENLLARNNLISGSCSSAFKEEVMSIGKEILKILSPYWVRRN